MSKSKTITGWLVVDWKSGAHRTRKSKPSSSELGTNELVAKLNVDVTVPEVEVPTLAVEIDVPEPQVYAATLDALDEDEMPDWSEAAIEAVDESIDAFEDADSHAEFLTVVDTAVVRTLKKSPGRPDVETVHDFIVDVANDMTSGGDASGGIQ
jgi:hypothetical protein